jgi:hypothetical protein
MSNIQKVYNDTTDKFEPMKSTENGLKIHDELSKSTLDTIDTNISTLANTVNQGGEQKVSVSSENAGSYNNIANNIGIASGATTSSVSIAEIARGNLFYQDSNIGSTDGLTVEVSADNTNWHVWGELLPYTAPGATVRTATIVDQSAHGLKWLKLRNTSNGIYNNVKASVYGSH